MTPPLFCCSDMSWSLSKDSKSLETIWTWEDLGANVLNGKTSLKMTSKYFRLLRDSFNSFNLSNVAEQSRSWLCKDGVTVQVEKRKFTVVCSCSEIKLWIWSFHVVLQRTAKKCTKICIARAESLFCLWSSRQPSPPSLLKFGNVFSGCLPFTRANRSLYRLGRFGQMVSKFPYRENSVLDWRLPFAEIPTTYQKNLHDGDGDG